MSRRRNGKKPDKSQSRDFGGYGKIRCAICGEPFTEHATMEMCRLTKPATVAYLEDEKRKRRRG